MHVIEEPPGLAAALLQWQQQQHQPVLSTSEIEALHRDGVVVIRKLIADEQILKVLVRNSFRNHSGTCALKAENCNQVQSGVLLKSCHAQKTFEDKKNKENSVE